MTQPTSSEIAADIAARYVAAGRTVPAEAAVLGAAKYIAAYGEHAYRAADAYGDYEPRSVIASYEAMAKAAAAQVSVAA